MAMEKVSESESFAIDSFSRSWLINPGSIEITDSSSLRSSIDEGPTSFIEMDPRLPSSKSFGRDLRNSDFRFPDSKSPVPLVHADDLFCNGKILAGTVSPLNKTAADQDGSCSDGFGNLTASKCKDHVSTSSSKNPCPMLKRCKTVSRNMFLRYLSCLQPLIRRRSMNSKVAENSMTSPETLPRMSIASYSVYEHWRKSCGSESSIDEAVLHCKRSIGK